MDMEHEAFTSELLDGLEDGAYCVDKTRRIIRWNGAAERMTGYTADAVVGSRCWHNVLRHVDDDGHQLCRGWCPLVATMQDGVPREARVYMHHREGHRVSVQVHVHPVRGADGSIIGAVEMFSPIELPECDPDEEQLETDEQPDSLTGLVGMKTVQARIERWLEGLRLGGPTFGLVLLHIDAREQVGGSFDLETCEAIIKAVGSTIHHVIRVGDVAARIGDEQFLVLLPSSNAEEIETQAKRLAFLVEQTFLVKNRRLVRVSAATSTALSAPEDTAETLLARVTTAFAATA